MSQRQVDKPVTDNSPMLQQILEELSSLKAEVDSLKRVMGMSEDSDKECSPDDEEDNTKEGILAKVKKLSTPLPNPKRYKTISIETISKLKNSEQKKLLQQAYDILKDRRLLTATNRPHDGWKFDFQRKSIELLFRVDNRRSAVYNTRHRPLIPRVIDGKIIKEEATAGEQYSIPYGLEKIDYSYKTIFVTEGIYDTCFLKNCLAYSNWILPNKMSKVLDIYREAGFQIIHILDNFRLKDKGGVKGLEWITEKREWLSKGDKVFSWGIYSEFKDFNDVAIAYGLDEIDPQTIIDHSWNEEEARANYKNFMPTGDNQQPLVIASREQKEEIITAAQNLTDELVQSDEYGLDLKSTVTAIEEEEKPCKSPSPNHLSDKDYRDNPPAMKDLYDDLDEMVENDAHDTQPTYDDDFERVLAEIEQEQMNFNAERLKAEEERKKWIKEYEDMKEQEMWELNKTTQAIYNPQTYLYKTPGITIPAPQTVR